MTSAATRCKRALLLKIRKDVRLVEPEVLQRIGEESKAKGTQKRTSKQIDTMSKAARASRTKSS
jgi:hypothetical protein